MAGRRRGGGARRRLQGNSESSSDTSDRDNEIRNTITEARAERIKRRLMELDLGSNRREQITERDPGQQPLVNKALIEATREFKQPGTEAAKKFSENLDKTAAWTNYGNTVVNDGTFENLKTIADGQSHRLRMREAIEAEKDARGGKLDLLDTYDELHGPVRRAGADNRLNIGGSGAKVTHGADHGRRGPSIPVKKAVDRPLDPAVDPSRAYTYSGKKGGSSYSGGTPQRIQAGRDQGTIDRGTVKVKPTVSSRASSIVSAKASRPVKRPVNPGYLSQLDDKDAFMAAVRAAEVATQQPHPIRQKVEEQEEKTIDFSDVRKVPVSEFAFPPPVNAAAQGDANWTDGQPSPQTLSLSSPASDAATLGISRIETTKPVISEEEDGDVSTDLVVTGVAVEGDLIDVDPAPELESEPPSSAGLVDLLDDDGFDTLFKSLEPVSPNPDFLVINGKRYINEEKVSEVLKLHTSGVSLNDSYALASSPEKENTIAEQGLSKTQPAQTTPSLSQSRWASPAVAADANADIAKGYVQEPAPDNKQAHKTSINRPKVASSAIGSSAIKESIGGGENHEDHTKFRNGNAPQLSQSKWATTLMVADPDTAVDTFQRFKETHAKNQQIHGSSEEDVRTGSLETSSPAIKTDSFITDQATQFAASKSISHLSQSKYASHDATAMPVANPGKGYQRVENLDIDDKCAQEHSTMLSKFQKLTMASPTKEKNMVGDDLPKPKLKQTPFQLEQGRVSAQLTAAQPATNLDRGYARIENKRPGFEDRRVREHSSHESHVAPAAFEPVSAPSKKESVRAGLLGSRYAADSVAALAQRPSNRRTEPPRRGGKKFMPPGPGLAALMEEDRIRRGE